MSRANVRPEEYILAVLSPEDRVEAALEIARVAFRGTALKLADVEGAVRKLRRSRNVNRRKKTKDGR